MVRQLRQEVEQVGVRPEGVVSRAEALRDGVGMGALVEAALAEADREGLDRAVALARSRGRHEARVDPAAQVDAQWHVAPQSQGGARARSPSRWSSASSYPPSN